jgi:hypothetical protein
VRAGRTVLEGVHPIAQLFQHFADHQRKAVWSSINRMRRAASLLFQERAEVCGWRLGFVAG